VGTTTHRRLRFRAAFAFALGIALVLSVAGVASAQPTDPSDDDQIVLNGRLFVPSSQTVGTAVLFNGSARIDGTVEESLVVFNGDVVVTGTVAGDVMVFNGDVRIASGAEIGGNLVTQSTPDVEPGATVRGDQQRVSGRIDLTDIGFASRIAWWVAYTASTLALGLFMLLVAPGLDATITRTIRERIGASFGFGAIAFFAIPIVAVLLLITVVGIPLGVFILLALALIYTVAYVAGAHAVGRLVVKPPGSRYLAFVAGLAALRVLALIPVLGGLTWFVATLLGFGVLLVGARAERTARPLSPSSTPPPPPPTMPGATVSP
jgi:hypothetical protein